MTARAAIRSAAPSDLAAASALLADAKLPVDDVAEHFASFLVAELGGRVVGVAGLERCGDVALVRSVAVEAALRGQQLGHALCAELFARAERGGVRELHLLTEHAAGFFARLGFAPEARDSAPPAIRATRQFSALCPASAQLMRRKLE